MKRLAFLILIFGAAVQQAQAQYTDSIPNPAPEKQSSWQKFRQRLSFGGAGGVIFGTVTNINLSPTVGYRVNNSNIFGVGINYIYYSDRRFTPDYTTTVYGYNIFDRQFLTKELFLHAEYQSLNSDLTMAGIREWNTYILAGGGYMPARGLYVTALYVLQQPVNSIYGDQPLVLRIGVMF